MSHQFVGPHPDVLEPDGRPVAMGEVVDQVDLNQPHNARLVEKSWLIEHAEPQPEPVVEPVVEPESKPEPAKKRGTTTTDQEAS